MKTLTKYPQHAQKGPRYNRRASLRISELWVSAADMRMKVRRWEIYITTFILTPGRDDYYPVSLPSPDLEYLYSINIESLTKYI
jgi:hypothetical protein